MTIPNDILSEMLAQMARSHLSAIRVRLDDFDDMLCTAILIEAARVIDYENVLMGSSEDESHHLPYPAFDIMSRGWNLLLHYALPRLPKTVGIPIQESTATTRSHARSLLHAFGKCAILQKAADMSLHGFLTGSESEGGLSLKFTVGDDSDHFLDQLEAEALDRAMNGDADSMPISNMTAAEVNDLTASLVFPFETGRGTMVGYDADPLGEVAGMVGVEPKAGTADGEIAAAALAFRPGDRPEQQLDIDRMTGDPFDHRMQFGIRVGDGNGITAHDSRRGLRGGS